MIERPQVMQTEAQRIAAIHLTIPKAAIQHEMGPGLNELMETVAGQGVGITGPWFTHHFQISPDGWDFEICVPVTAPVEAAGRVKSGEVPAMKVVRTTFRGPYEGLGSAWGEFNAWIAAEGLEVGPDLWESYAVGPESGGDPSTWRTELTRRLIG